MLSIIVPVLHTAVDTPPAGPAGSRTRWRLMQREWVLPCCYRGTISRNAATLLGTNRAGSNGSVQLESPGAVVIEDHAMLLTMPHISMLSLRADGFRIGNASNRQVSLSLAKPPKCGKKPGVSLFRSDHWQPAGVSP